MLELAEKAEKIVVFTGSGLSASSGVCGKSGAGGHVRVCAARLHSSRVSRPLLRWCRGSGPKAVLRCLHDDAVVEEVGK